MLQRETIAVHVEGDAIHDGDALSGSAGSGAAAAAAAAKGSVPMKLRNFVPSRHLWIGCLSNTTKAKITDIFAVFGDIEDVSFLKVRWLAPESNASTRVRCNTARMCLAGSSVRVR